MKTQDYIFSAEQHLLHTYNRYQIVLEKGEGVYLYDIEGKQYLDFGAGIAVFAFGYHNVRFNDALKKQIDKLIHTSNLYYNIPATEAAKKVTRASGMDRVFFTNSGTEAIEGAIKLARKYAFVKDGSTDHEIIGMRQSFHGRSLGALSVTGNPKYQEAFQPLIGGVKFAEFNNLESVKKQLTNKTCAIILEPVQGEGGIYPAEEVFLKELRQLCNERDIILIFDEIQCGMGRTGTMFAWEQYGVKPDILTIAKALGCGIPVGAFAAVETVAKAMVPGDHGSTYGGNPLACTAVNEVFSLFEETDILPHVRRVGSYLEMKLNKIVEDFEIAYARRGKGLMQGLELTIPVSDIILKALDSGLILISAGTNVIRFVPPLIIEEQHIDEMISILRKLLEGQNK